MTLYFKNISISTCGFLFAVGLYFLRFTGSQEARKEETRKSATGFCRLVGVVALSMAALPGAANASDDRCTDTLRQFDIVQEQLDKALLLFSKQACVRMLFPYDSVTRSVANSVKGVFTVQGGLDQLLEGSGFSGRLTKSGIVVVAQVTDDPQAQDQEETVDIRKIRNGSVRGRALVSLAALTAAATQVQGSAQAQDEADVEDRSYMEEVVVTGTRREGRSVVDSPVPVDVINSDQLLNSGLTETGALLNRLIPSFNFPQPSLTDGTDSVRPAQLRGLAPDHTLVLVNGKRRHTSSLVNLNGSIGRGSVAVDLNLIPASAIKRVEVLRDGAAAQYGSDAIAGVINFALNDAREGVSMSVQYGQHVTDMDGVRQLESVSFAEDGSLVFTESDDDRHLNDGEEMTIRGNVGLPIGDAGFFNVSGEYRDKNPTARNSYTTRQNYPALEDGSLDPRELTFDRYNFRFGNPEVEDLTLFYNAGLPVGDFELYSFGSYGERDSYSAGFYRRAQDSRNVAEIYPDGFLPLINVNFTDMSYAVGVRGDLGEWSTDLSVVYGENDLEFGVLNSLNTSLGANSPTEFDAGGLKNSQTVANLDVSRLFEVSGRSLNVALGLEYRDEGYEITAGEPASYITGDFPGQGGSQVFNGFQPASEVDRSRDSISGYVDLDMDVTDRFNLAVAGRYEDYSDFGSTLNGKIAGRYALTDELALRGSVSTGFRAPSLAQQSFTSIALLAIDDDILQVGTFTPDSDFAVALGSPGLKEEKSIGFSAGLTYSSGTGLTVTADYFYIEIDDRIILSSNFSGDEIEALLADFGVNAVGGRFFLNGIDSRTQGVDLVATYNMELADFGTLDLNAGFNYTKNEVTDRAQPLDRLEGLVDAGDLFSDVEVRRFENGSPKTTLNLGAVWNWDRLSITARTTRYGKTVDAQTNPAEDEVMDAKFITDMEVSYRFNDTLRLAVGGNNIFDIYPDTAAEINQVNGASTSTFDQIFPYSGFSPYGFSGRYLYARVDLTF